jgi:two-component system OmpR family sensor kinase
VSRLPIRVKLTVIFAGAMAVLLVVVGVFLFTRTKSNLDGAIRASLTTRQGNLRAFARANPEGGARRIEPGERFAQLIAADGRVLESRPPDTPRLLSPGELETALRAKAFIERGEEDRLLAGPARYRGRRVAAVVGASLADRERALEGLGGALLIGGPLVLLLASAIGYWLASAALRPVESMRRRAETISTARQDAHLPVPEARDEIRRLGETLNEMLDRLAAAAAQERSFVDNASHELRTPLTTLRAELELALRGPRGEAVYREALQRSLEHSDQLAGLAEDLLILARVDDGTPLPSEPIAVRPLLGAAVELFRHRPETAARDITVHAEDLCVLGDEPALKRAVANLIDNALVHGEGDVEVTARATGATVAISVLDQGEHLDDELREHAFERFVHGPGRGTGIGLSIVRAVADAHGGAAELRNRPQGGVEARLTLPAAAPAR